MSEGEEACKTMGLKGTNMRKGEVAYKGTFMSEGDVALTTMGLKETTMSKQE